MKPKDLIDLRAAFCRDASSELAGRYGEAYAAAWMEGEGWRFESIDQAPGGISQALRDWGGKRPDFITLTATQFVAIDAKYLATNGGRTFVMRDTEVDQYRRLRSFMHTIEPQKIPEVMFMVFPKEFNGQRFAAILLESFDRGQVADIQGDAAVSIDIDEAGEWLDLSDDVVRRARERADPSRAPAA